MASSLCAGAALACEGEAPDIAIEHVELASGEYYGLAWGGTQVERFHVLAQRGTPGGEVVIVSPQRDEPCSLGELSSYSTLQPLNGGKYVLGAPSPARITIFDPLQPDGRGRLGFADLSCQRLPLQLDDIKPGDVRRLYRPDLMDLRLAVPTGEGELRFVDPWEQTQEVVARDVSGVWPHEHGVWLIEGGQAVRRDLAGEQIARHGNDVRELLPLGPQGDLAYVDDSGLVLRLRGEQMRLEEDACRLRTLSGFLPQSLSYFSPCESRKLVVRDVSGRTLRYEQRVEALLAQGGRLLFTVHVDERTTQLWLALASTPSEVTLLAERPRFRLESMWSAPGGKLVVAAREDGQAIELWSVSVGGAPELVTLERDIVALRSYEGAIALLKGDGTLSLRRRADLRTLVQADDVSEFRFIFGGSSTALAYIAQSDPDTRLGELHLHFLSGEHFLLDEAVRELREVWWPESGVLYAKSGKHPSLTFARIDIPCEVRSDSPWACGF